MIVSAQNIQQCADDQLWAWVLGENSVNSKIRSKARNGDPDPMPYLTVPLEQPSDWLSGQSGDVGYTASQGRGNFVPTIAAYEQWQSDIAGPSRPPMREQ